MEMQTQSSRSFAFIFPLASGHINPSLAIARSLVLQGHDVHYLCREQMREAIEDTGAMFHSDIETQPEEIPRCGVLWDPCRRSTA